MDEINHIDVIHDMGSVQHNKRQFFSPMNVNPSILWNCIKCVQFHPLSINLSISWFWFIISFHTIYNFMCDKIHEHRFFHVVWFIYIISNSIHVYFLKFQNSKTNPRRALRIKWMDIWTTSQNKLMYGIYNSMIYGSLVKCFYTQYTIKKM